MIDALFRPATVGLALVGLLVGWLHPIERPGGATFRGIHLTPPEPVRGVSAQPAPAWLIVGRVAVPATFGSYCYGACVDMVDPRMMPHVARASVPPNARALIVIDVSQIKEFHAELAPWREHAGARPRPLGAQHSHRGRFEVFSLGRLGRVHNGVLSVFVTFPPRVPNSDPHVVGGDASYLWRINP